MNNPFPRSLVIFFVALLLAWPAAYAAKPNIVLIITDDQGYGDLGCTGNPVIKTPHIDTLAKQSVRLRHYHVAPTCSPTRAALMSGRWTNRTGVWHTIMGRSMIRANEVLLSQLLKDAGYETGMFGKWHLGDNYPYRPEDRGFTEVYRHGGGGVGQTPDLWDNSYFDGNYFHNGKIVPAKGFCTDVFFEEGTRFIKESVKKKKPFFAYISTNAPHSPLHCPQKYIDMYKDLKKGSPSFFGMITNIDDNVGALRKTLRELGVEKDTIFIFTTDNGTAGGANVFNAGMRGKKGSEYDGGHRVPFFLHYPAGKLNKEHVVPTVCHAVDVVPTLLDFAGADVPTEPKIDGVTLRPLMEANDPSKVEWPDRMLVTDSQRVVDPVKWRKCSVMSQRWRLVNGTELYEIAKDPGQEKNVAEDHPEVVEKMRTFYEAWWADIEPTFSQTTELHVGVPSEPKVLLTGHDWIGPDFPPWNQGHIRDGAHPKTVPTFRNHWAIKVTRTGTYRVSLMRYPPESGKAIRAKLPKGGAVPGHSQAFRDRIGVGFDFKKATVRLNGHDVVTKGIANEATRVNFKIALEEGSHQFSPYFAMADGQQIGSYYAVIEGPLGGGKDGAKASGKAGKKAGKRAGKKANAKKDTSDIRPLFDGKTLKGWNGDPKFWRVEDGALTGETTKENPTKGNTFLIWEGGEPENFELTFAYRIFSGNSGFQFRSFHAKGADEWRVGGYQADFDQSGQWAGTLYGERYRGILAKRGESVVYHEPKKRDVMTPIEGATADKLKAAPEWNHYRVVAKGNHIEQFINGQKMVSFTDKHEEARAKGILAIQVHAGPPMKVQVKNVQLREF